MTIASRVSRLLKRQPRLRATPPGVVAAGVVPALVALACGAVLALLPPNVSQEKLVWSAGAGEVVQSELLRSIPPEIRIEFQCGSTWPVEQARVLDTGEWWIKSTGQDLELVISSAEAKIQTPQVVPLGGSSVCPAALVLDNSMREALLTFPQSEDAVLTAYPSGFYASLESFVASSTSALEVMSIEVLARGAFMEQGPLRATLFWLSLIAWFVVGVHALWPKMQTKNLRELFSKLFARGAIWIDTLVLGGLLGSALILPFIYDEGWVFFRSQLGLKTGTHLEYFWAASPYTFQGIWWESVLGSLIGTGAGIFHLELLMVLVCWLTWLTVSRFAYAVIGSRDMRWQVIAAAIYLSFALSLLVTLRPEAIVGLALAVSLALVPSIIRQPTQTNLFIFGSALAVGVSVHQTGVTLLGVAAFVGYQLLWTDRKQLPKLLGLAGFWVALASNFGLLLSLIFMKLDFRILVQEFLAWDARQGYQRTEFDRIASLVQGPDWRSWSLVLFMLAVLFVVLVWSKLGREQRQLSTAALLATASLSLTASKWEWHVAVLAAPVVFFSVLALRTAVLSLRRRELSQGFALGVTVLFLLSTVRGWGPALRDGTDFAFRYHILGATEKAISPPIMTLILFLLTVALMWVGVWSTEKVRRFWIASALLAVIFLTPMARYAAALLADSIYAGEDWTLPKQRVTPEFACGLPVEGRGLDIQSLLGEESNVSFADQGTGAQSFRRSGGDVRIPAQKGIESVAIWLKLETAELDPAWSAVQQVTLSGAEVLNWEGPEKAEAWTGNVFSSYWRLVRVAVSDEDQVLTVEAGLVEDEIDLLIKKPEDLMDSSWSKILYQDKVLVNPGLIPYTPCLNLAGVDGELLERPGYAIGKGPPPRAGSFAAERIEIGHLSSRGRARVELFAMHFPRERAFSTVDFGSELVSPEN